MSPAGVFGFVFACFAVTWAWLNYSWFASAYDTDDWVFRLATFVQMAGVIVLTLGLAPMFESLDHGGTVDNGVMVAGYVVMRVPLLFCGGRSRSTTRRGGARRGPTWRSSPLAQAGWIALAIVGLDLGPTLVALALLVALEMAGPRVAESKGGTPWHPHHIAERYGLLVIITLGEVILGAVASVEAVVNGEAGWSLDAALLLVAGVGLAFGCWWMYFAVPWAEPLVRHRERAWVFGYGHLFGYAALAAMGAGLHVAAIALEGKAEIGAVAIVLSAALPFAIYTAVFYALYSLLIHTRDPFHLGLLAGTAGWSRLSVGLAAAGASVAVSLLVLALAPAVTVVGYETLGHRHMSDALQRL
jgi:low temperature requirement protein LtrA